MIMAMSIGSDDSNKHLVAPPSSLILPRSEDEVTSKPSNKGQDTQPKQKAKEPKRELTVRPIPREGMPKVIYTAKKLVTPKDRPFVIPKMTAHDQLMWDISELIAELRRLASLLQMKIVVLNSKGGAAKTPTTAYLATTFMDVTNDPTVILDMNQNFGNMNDWLGIAREDTMGLREAIQFRDQLINFSAIAKAFRSHAETGVRLMASEDLRTMKLLSDAELKLPREEQEKLLLQMFTRLIDNVFSAVHSVFLDTGNGMDYESNLSSVRAANVFLFSGLWDKRESYDGIIATIGGYGNRFTREMIRNKGYIVISDTPARMERKVVFDTFLRHVHDNIEHLYMTAYDAADADGKEELDHELARYGMPGMFGVSEERFFAVPHSADIAQGARRTDASGKVIGLKVGGEAIGFNVRKAFLEILRTIFHDTLLRHEGVVRSLHATSSPSFNAQQVARV